MVTGSRGRYQWLVDERYGIGHLIERCPQVLLGRYLVIARFDSGPLRPNAEEAAAGWRFENQLTYTPRLESLNLLPYEEYDEWYVFASPTRLASCDTFINFGGFTLSNPEESLAALHPTWDQGAAETLAEEQVRQQEQFWSQLERFGAESYIADGDKLHLRHS